MYVSICMLWQQTRIYMHTSVHMLITENICCFPIYISNILLTFICSHSLFYYVFTRVLFFSSLFFSYRVFAKKVFHFLFFILHHFQSHSFFRPGMSSMFILYLFLSGPSGVGTNKEDRLAPNESFTVVSLIHHYTESYIMSLAHSSSSSCNKQKRRKLILPLGLKHKRTGRDLVIEVYKSPRKTRTSLILFL